MLLNKLSLFYNNRVSKSFKYNGMEELKDLLHSNNLNSYNNIFGNHCLELLFIERVYNKKIHLVFGLLLVERIDLETFIDDDFHYEKLLQLRDIYFDIKDV